MIARSLGSAGHIVDLGFSYGSRFFAAYSKYCRNYLFYPDPSYALNDFIAFFKALAGKYDFIIPTMEKTQLALSMTKKYLEKMGTTLPIPEHELLSIATRKEKMIEISNKNEITLPKTLLLTEEPELKEVIKEIGLPFIMKASTEMNVPTGPSSRYIVIKREIAQQDFLKKFRQLTQYGPVILQQCIEGVGIGVSFIFSRHHNLIAFFGHRRLLERFPEGGPSLIAETYFHPEAIMQGLKLLSILNWQGIAMTEFKLGSDGKLYFMELNPRFWGTLPLAIASGLNFPRLLVDYYNSSQESIDPNLATKKRIFVNCLTTPYLFITSLKMRNLSFAKEIFRSTLGIFKHGFPFLVEFEKFDLLPGIKLEAYSFYASLCRNKFSKIGSVFFGPEIPYEKLMEFNVRSIVDLRERSEKTNINIDGKIKYISFPIKDDSAPELTSFLSLIFIIDQLVKKEPIYIHCRLGRGRAPMVVIAYLISKGIPISEAYSIVYNARPFTYLNLIQKRAIYEIYKNYLKTVV